jgi:hypothetical protein
MKPKARWWREGIQAMTNEFHYRGGVITASPRSSNSGWTHDGVVQQHLGYAVDDHLFCAPGRSLTRDAAIKAIVVCGRRIIDEQRERHIITTT